MPKTKTKKEVEIVNGLKLPFNSKGGHLVPPPSHYVDNDKILEKLVYSIQDNHPVLLIGETGTGKTSAIRYLAEKTNNNFRRLNLNGQTTVDEFVGKIMINEKGTYWVDGVLTEALREGHWLVLDELNSALPEVLFVLQSLLDDDRYIVLSDKEDKEIVRPHKNFRLFATMNPSDGYVGTKDMNKALMSRFSMVLNIDYPKIDDEVDIIENRSEGIDREDIKQIVEVAHDLRSSYNEGEMDFVLSTRDLIAWTIHQKHFRNWIESAYATFMYKCNEDDRKAIDRILKINFKNNLGTISKKEDLIDMINDLKRNNIEGTLRLNKDLMLYNRTDRAIKQGSAVVPQTITKVPDGTEVVLLRVEKAPTGRPNTHPTSNGVKYSNVGTQQTIKVEDVIGSVDILLEDEKTNISDFDDVRF